jgi:hypothetical protein
MTVADPRFGYWNCPNTACILICKASQPMVMAREQPE